MENLDKDDVLLDDLAGLEATVLVFDGSLHLFLGGRGSNEDEREYDLSIGPVPFQVTCQDEDTVTAHFAPGSSNPAVSLDHLAKVHLARVAGGTAHAGGSLDLWFGNGMTLHVDPDERSEAWTLTSAAGTLASEPGGGLTTR